MKNSNVSKDRMTRPILHTAFAAALALAFTVSAPQTARSQQITPPAVPAGLEVDGTAFLIGHAVGSQNYICLPSGSGFAYSLFTPEATLFNDYDDQIITHFFSRNPHEAGAPIRATWESSRDTSTVWAATVPNGASTDPNFVAPGAVAWLKLAVVGASNGPTGGDKLSDTTFIQRVNTRGGVAPSTGCSQPSDVGNRAFMPYTADYIFYRKADDHK